MSYLKELEQQNEELKQLLATAQETSTQWQILEGPEDIVTYMFIHGKYIFGRFEFFKSNPSNISGKTRYVIPLLNYKKYIVKR